MTAPFFGYHMPNFSFPGVPPEDLFDHVATLAAAAETAGFDLVTVMDHVYQIRGVGPEAEPMLEAYTTLGALAARTTRARLGTLVTGVTYRNPALLVKMVSTLDVISRGRAVFGIGAAWNEDEHRGYGFEFPPIKERLDRLEEALRIARAMFDEERPSFEGAHHKIDRALNSPRPIQPGGPPILVGGGGERRTLRIAARYADITHWFGSIEDLKRKGDLLERYCEEAGRDPSKILRTCGAPVMLAVDDAHARELRERVPAEIRARVGEPVVPEAAAGRLREYMEAGMGGFTFGNLALGTPELIAAAGELRRMLA